MDKDGENTLEIKNMSEKLKISIPLKSEVSQEEIKKNGLYCVYWDTDAQQWGRNGGTLKTDLSAAGTIEAITCEWDHMTDFAVGMNAPLPVGTNTENPYAIKIPSNML